MRYAGITVLTSFMWLLLHAISVGTVSDANAQVDERTQAKIAALQAMWKLCQEDAKWEIARRDARIKELEEKCGEVCK